MPIIINGGSYRAGGWWAKHLQNGEKNERVQVVEFSGLTAETVPGAFREMEGIAAGTKCKNYFYQANINPREDERLTPAQWREAIDTLEKNLGLTGQPRFVIEHEKKGRVHRHVVWSRIDADRMVAISDSLTAAIHERTSRTLEITFDLERGRSILTPDRAFERPERRPQKSETFRTAETGIDPQTVKAELRAFWRQADNGQSFKAALENAGYVLARGDRRDFVVIDRAGDDHSLARRLGVKAADVRERMADIDRDALPSVADAKTQQRARPAQRGPAEAGQGRDTGTTAGKAPEGSAVAPGRSPAPPLGKTAGDIRTAWSLTRGEDLHEALAARGITLAIVSADEARHSERTAAFAREVGRFARVWREGEIVAVNQAGQVHRLDQRTTGQSRAEIKARLAGIDPASLLNVTDAKEVMRKVSRARAADAREQARPANWMERRIADCAEQARVAGATVRQDAEGRTVSAIEDLADQFRPADERTHRSRTVHGREAVFARLEDAGIAIARVTEADILALAALRHDAEMTRIAAETNRETFKGNRVEEIELGQLAAVTRHGDVYRINAAKLGDATRHLATDLPSVTETRALFEIEREQKSELWAARREEIATQREEYAASRERRAAVAHMIGEARQAEHAVETAIDHGERTATRAGRGLARIVESILGGVLNFLIGGPPPLTKQQAHDQAQAEGSEETLHARAYAAEAQANEAARNEEVFQQNKVQEKDVRLAQTLGIPAAPEALAGRDEYERKRRDRDRETERD